VAPITGPHFADIQHRRVKSAGWVFNLLIILRHVTGVRRHLGGAPGRPPRPGAGAGHLGRHLPGAAAGRHPARRRCAARDPSRRRRRGVRTPEAHPSLDQNAQPMMLFLPGLISVFTRLCLCFGDLNEMRRDPCRRRRRVVEAHPSPRPRIQTSIMLGLSSKYGTFQPHPLCRWT